METVIGPDSYRDQYSATPLKYARYSHFTGQASNLSEVIRELHHCITASLHHSITASQHHCVTASLHHCITASLHHNPSPLTNEAPRRSSIFPVFSSLAQLRRGRSHGHLFDD